MALAVDEHQRAGRAKTAKIEDIEPGGADEAGRVALAEGRAQRRKIVERVAERNVTRIGQFADAHRGERNRRAECRARSEEQTSEHPSLMRHSYAVFCLKKKTHN